MSPSFERNNLYVRAGKGGKDRTTILPTTIKSTLQHQLQKVKQLHDEDLKNGFGEVFMPEALGLLTNGIPVRSQI